MRVDRQLDANAPGDQPDLAAEIAHGIDVGLGIWVDPGDAPANPKTLGRHWSDRSQQPAQDEDRDDDRPARERANGRHAHLLSVRPAATSTRDGPQWGRRPSGSTIRTAPRRFFTAPSRSHCCSWRLAVKVLTSASAASCSFLMRTSMPSAERVPLCTPRAESARARRSGAEASMSASCRAANWATMATATVSAFAVSCGYWRARRWTVA